MRAELYNNGFEYGFIVNDQKYKPNRDNGFDNEYYHLAKTISIVQDPSVTLKEKIGTCVDIVLVMKSILDNLNIPSKIWLLYNKSKIKCILYIHLRQKVKSYIWSLHPNPLNRGMVKKLFTQTNKSFYKSMKIMDMILLT